MVDMRRRAAGQSSQIASVAPQSAAKAEGRRAGGGA
jgi:hypothetical protein